jgi:hydrogenase nickel incorporation protein HypB
MDSVRLIEIKEEILSDNKDLADELRSKLTREKTFLLNLMASPGAGKTSLILRTIEHLKDELRLGVIEADIDSIVDSEKVAARGITAVQLKTGGFCHVDAAMVSKGLDTMALDALDLIIIENVGNLVCPAEVDTGATRNAMILSIPEGDDKPLKYPVIFTACDALVVNKIDYLEHSDFDLDVFRDRVLKLNPAINIFEISCKTGQGVDQWASWLKKEVGSLKSP